MNGSRARLLREAAGGYFFGHHADPYAGLEVERERRRRGLREVDPVPAVAKVDPGEPLPDLPGLDPSCLESVDYEPWLRGFFPERVTKSFAPHHHRLWSWAWSIVPDRAPRPFVFIVARGGGKSESGELIVASLLARKKASYFVYVSETQIQADERVENVGALLESPLFGAYYPEAGSRGVGKYGSSKGWRRNRLVTASGQVVDALGLDSARRSKKFGRLRPGFFVFDDIDALYDSADETKRKIGVITRTILPMATATAPILFVQNLILSDGVFAQLADGRADWLSNRIVVGPIPAIRGLETAPEEYINEEGERKTRDVIIAGEATWEGQSLADCQALITRLGLTAFDLEQQHLVTAPAGALWKDEDIHYVESVPEDLLRVVVGVDPSGGKTETGIVRSGKGRSGRVYVFEDSSQPGAAGPDNWACAAVESYIAGKADAIVAEKNFGGDMVASTIKGHLHVLASPLACGHGGRSVNVAVTTSSRGKRIRAEPVAAACRRGEVVFVGRKFAKLVRELKYWDPNDPRAPSPNRLDAFVFSAMDLIEPTKAVQSFAAARPPGY